MPIAPAKDSIANWFMGLRSDYEAARKTRFSRPRRGIPTQGAHADWHYRSEVDFLRIMEVARDFHRNDGVVGQGVSRLVANVIREGFTLDVNTGDQSIDDELEARWNEWSTNEDECDIQGEMTFAEMESKVFESMVVDGDIFPVLLEDGQILFFEAHRCRTPTNAARRKNPVVHGVLMDSLRKRQEYWFTKEDVDIFRPINRVGDMIRLAARDDSGNRQVLHIALQKRFSQTRGVSALAPMFNWVSMHDDIQFAKLVQQQVVSAFGIIRKQGDGFEGRSTDIGETRTETTTTGATRTLEGIGPGMEILAKAGEEIQAWSSNVPNPEWFAQANLVLTFVAVNLDLPLVVLLLDANNSNFSAFRSSLDQARLRFCSMQSHVARHFHKHVYRWKVRNWIAEDRALGEASISGNVDIFGHTWHAPKWDYIEPINDAKADRIQLDSFLMSQRRIHAKRGRKWEDVAREIVDDNRHLYSLACVAANEINAEFPEHPIEPLELLGIHAAIANDANNDQQQDNGKESAA